MSFEVAADAYDRFMGRFSAPLAEAFVSWALLPPNGRVLDVGCGPGAQLAALLRERPADEVTAVDRSASFVDAARRRFPEVEVVEGSAEDLPFDDGTFSAAIAGLVLHFIEDPAVAVAEMVRVCVPGGVVAATVWDLAGSREPYAVFSRALAGSTEIPPHPVPTGAHSGDLAGLLLDAGCADVEETALPVRVRFTSFEEWWEPYTLGVSTSGAQLAALPEPERDRVRERCRHMLGDDSFTITAVAWAARGTARFQDAASRAFSASTS
jgi:SAM-dependent methyltransferase